MTTELSSVVPQPVYYEHRRPDGTVLLTGWGMEDYAWNVLAAVKQWPDYDRLLAEDNSVRVHIFHVEDPEAEYQIRTTKLLAEGVRLVNSADKSLLVNRRRPHRAGQPLPIWEPETDDQKYPGVKKTTGGRWSANIRRALWGYAYLGTFPTFEEAKAARQRAERTLSAWTQRRKK